MTINPASPPSDELEIAEKLTNRTIAMLDRHIGGKWRWNSERALFVLEGPASPAIRGQLATKLGERGYPHQTIYETTGSKIAMDKEQTYTSIDLARRNGYGITNSAPVISSMIDASWSTDAVLTRAAAKTQTSHR